MNDKEPCSSTDEEICMIFIILVALSLSCLSRGGGFAIRPSGWLARLLASSLALGIGVEFGVRVKTSLQSPVTSLSERARVFRIEGKEGTDRFSVTQR